MYYQETFSSFLLGVCETQSKNSWLFYLTYYTVCTSHSVKERKVNIRQIDTIYIFMQNTIFYPIHFIILFIDIHILLTFRICLFICFSKIPMTTLELWLVFQSPLLSYMTQIRNRLKTTPQSKIRESLLSFHFFIHDLFIQWKKRPLWSADIAEVNCTCIQYLFQQTPVKFCVSLENSLELYREKHLPLCGWAAS